MFLDDSLVFGVDTPKVALTSGRVVDTIMCLVFPVQLKNYEYVKFGSSVGTTDMLVVGCMDVHACEIFSRIFTPHSASAA
eukprot:3755850-Amphidinium_carterae.1